jgi:L-methionine (R)-S-oxide reductase
MNDGPLRRAFIKGPRVRPQKVVVWIILYRMGRGGLKTGSTVTDEGMTPLFTVTDLQYKTKEQFYNMVVEQVSHLIAGEPNEMANLSNVAALLNVHMKDINWVGFYLWYSEEQSLILGPFQGKPACIRIPLGKGVCGTAAETRTSQVVPDVLAFPGHIACDPDSRAEVVVPMVKDGALIGVLDIDSPIPGRFDEEDAVGLQKVVDVLLAGTRFLTR